MSEQVRERERKELCSNVQLLKMNNTKNIYEQQQKKRRQEQRRRRRFSFLIVQCRERYGRGRQAGRQKLNVR